MQCREGRNTATALGSVSRWNGMKDHLGYGRFQNANIYRWHIKGVCPMLDMKCIFQNIRSHPTTPWQNVPKWQKKVTEDMAWMEMLIVAPHRSKRSALEAPTVKGGALNSLKVIILFPITVHRCHYSSASCLCSQNVYKCSPVQSKQILTLSLTLILH